MAAIFHPMQAYFLSKSLPQKSDSTLLATYGKQEGEGFNFHYHAHGYHPLLCYDGLTGDLLKAELRNGTQYCSNDADAFMIPLMKEFRDKYPSMRIVSAFMHWLTTYSIGFAGWCFLLL